MIITVTMNPAMDKTVEIEKLVPGGLNRIRKTEYDAGGKGINVSKTIHALGGESLATGILGGNTGSAIEHVLENLKIQHDFVRTEGETRTNTKIYEENGTVTELNEPGPVVSKEQVKGLFQKLDRIMTRDTILVLAGSLPENADLEIYAELTVLAHKKGARVILDADGAAFRKALEKKPDLIKPNKEELEEYFGVGTLTEEELGKKTKLLQQQGIGKIVVSMGKDGAQFIFPEGVVTCPALPVSTHSTVGAGDAMVAALAYAMEKELDEKETVSLCMAASAGAVMTTGTKPPSKECVESLKKQVKISGSGFR